MSNLEPKYIPGLFAEIALLKAQVTVLEDALRAIIDLDHHNHIRPSSRASTIARAALAPEETES